MNDRLADDHGVGWHYEAARVRLDVILRPLDRSGWEQEVAACPGWRVRDVTAHLVGIIEDAAAGLLSGPPTDEMAAAEVERHLGDDPLELLDAWAAGAPLLVDAVTHSRTWPAAFDIVSHEHDVRAALGAPGARDHESIGCFAELLFGALDPPVALTVVMGPMRLSSGGTEAPGAIVLRTSPFEFFRLRLGRRTRAEVSAMDWSEDPGEVVDHLFVFGPTEVTVGD